MPPKKPLASKEQSLFRELLNLYESKQLKKGLKAADQILKKSPDHGETLAMKGLILTHQGKREEGLDLVKKGIRLDITSHIVWHVFGLIQKAEKNYDEALKSYSQALRFDKENMNLLTDAATLQTHLRQYEILQDTRELILRLRPTTRKNWILLAFAFYLNGNLTNARTTLESYRVMVKDVPDYDVEHSNITLFYVRVLEEGGEFSEAISVLDASAKSRDIVDRTSIMEYRARILSKIGNSDEALEAWRALIEKNSDCYDYYYGYFKQRSLSLDLVTDENREETLRLLDDLSSHFPRATAPVRLSLAVAEGDEFKERVHTYIVDRLRRGIPSLFVDIKGLYSSPSKQKAIEEVALKFRDEFLTSCPLPKLEEESSESPCTYLWTLYFLAQHHSYLRRLDAAVDAVNLALEHTPTMPELYTCKARILKRAGDLLGAVKYIEDARDLDGQDRFLNTKSAKYHLRAGMVDEALRIFGLFTKKDATSPAADLEDMQSTLYLLEDADCQFRLGNLGLALKKYSAVQKAYDIMHSDQYDFHSYSMYKGRFTINAYINMLQWADRLRLQSPFITSSLTIARIYVLVHDDPSMVNPSNGGKRTEADKKAEKKAKKAAAKSAEDSKKQQANVPNDDKGLDPPPPKDEDPTGIKALGAADGLEQAWKLVSPLLPELAGRIDVLICAYDLSVRRKKFLQAVKMLLTAQAVDAQDPELHVRIVDFKLHMSPSPSQVPESVQSVIALALPKLIPEGMGLDAFNSQFLQRQGTSPKVVLAVAQVSRKLGAPADETESIVFGLLNPELQSDVKDALSALQFLTTIKSSRRDEFRIACGQRFKLSTMFKTSEELADYRMQNGSAAGEEGKEEELNV